MAKNNTKVIIQARAAYLACFEPKSFSKDGKGKYMATAIISKQDEKTLKKVTHAIQAAVEEGQESVWHGKIPQNLMLPLKDGDQREDGNRDFANSMYFTAKSNFAPQVVNQMLQPIFDPADIYSGCYVNVSVNFIPYNAGPNKGVTAMLGNIQLVKKGPSMSGRMRAEDEFSIIPQGSEEFGDMDEFKPIKDGQMAEGNDDAPPFA